MLDKALIPLCLLIIVIHPHFSRAQFRGCPMIDDRDTLAQLIAEVIAATGEQGPSATLLPTIAVRRNRTVCLSTGPDNGTVSSVSLLVEYGCGGCSHPQFADGNTTVEQFDFGCVSHDGSQSWSATQFGKTGSRFPSASFNTPLRRDCSACIEKRVANAVGLGKLLRVDPVSHCLACSSKCADTGMQMCYGLGKAMCCNYFLNNSCIDLCPNTTQPDADFNCQTVVIGFTDKVYFTEEQHNHLSLPVVVKEGNLTENVTLKVSVEDKSATAGEDYYLHTYRVDLVPGVNNNTGLVKIRIVNDAYREDDEGFLVRLMLQPGSHATINSSGTIVVIVGDQGDDEDSTESGGVNMTTIPTAHPHIDNGCELGTDEVWRFDWPSAAPGTTVTISCGDDNNGIATRECLSGSVWAVPNVTLCENTLIAEIGKMAEELFSRPDVQAEEALVVVSELAAASTPAATSQLPRDITTTSDILANTVDLLLQTTNNISDGHRNTVNISETIQVLDLLSSMLSDQNQDGFSNLQEMGTGSEVVLNTAEKYGQYVGKTLTDGENEEVLLVRRNIVLSSGRKSIHPGNKKPDATFPGENKFHNFAALGNEPVAMTIPGELLENNYEGNVTVTNMLFRDLHNLLPPVFNNGTVPRSFVISSQIYGRGVQQSNLFPFESTPVRFTFTVKLSHSEKLPRCAFWDFSEGIEGSGWSTEGVRTVSVTREGDTVTVTCASTHLTSFSVLVDVGGAKIDDKSLQIISYLGIAISLGCLFLTIIFFLSNGKMLFSAVHNFVHLNLAISLFVAYFIFAVGMEVAANNEIACKLVTALIQYFLLAAFCWMMCEGVMLYLMLVMVFSRLTEKWWFFLILGWGIPFIFVGIGVSTVLDEYGVRDSNDKLLYCWLSSGPGKYAIWTFVAPMLAIIAINTVFLVLVLRSIYVSKSGQEKTKKQKLGKRYSLATYIVKASLILLPLLGLTWVFGLFAINENTKVFAWLFTILNSLQGLSIFVLHVVRNERVWGKMRKSHFGKYSFARSWSKMTSSTNASSRFSKRKDSEGLELKDQQRAVSSGSMDVFESQEDIQAPPTVPAVRVNNNIQAPPTVPAVRVNNNSHKNGHNGKQYVQC